MAAILFFIRPHDSFASFFEIGRPVPARPGFLQFVKLIASFNTFSQVSSPDYVHNILRRVYVDTMTEAKEDRGRFVRIATFGCKNCVIDVGTVSILVIFCNHSIYGLKVIVWRRKGPVFIDVAVRWSREDLPTDFVSLDYDNLLALAHYSLLFVDVYEPINNPSAIYCSVIDGEVENEVNGEHFNESDCFFFLISARDRCRFDQLISFAFHSFSGPEPSYSSNQPFQAGGR